MWWWLGLDGGRTVKRASTARGRPRRTAYVRGRVSLGLVPFTGADRSSLITWRRGGQRMVRLGCGGLWGRFSGQEGEGSVWGREAGHSMGGVHPQPGGESDMRSHRRAKLWRAQELHPVRLEERAHLLRAVLVAVDHGAAELAAGLRGRSPVEASREHGAAPKRAAAGGAQSRAKAKGVLLSNLVLAKVVD